MERRFFPFFLSQLIVLIFTVMGISFNSSLIAVASEQTHISKNLLENPSFEEWEDDLSKPQSWSIRVVDLGVTYSMDCGEKVDGLASIKMHNEKPDDYSFVAQQIILKKNTNYIAKAWLKLEGVTEPAVRIGVYIPRGPTLRASSPRLSGNHSWHEVEISFNSGDYEAVNFMVQLNSAAGTCWVDNASLREVK